MGRMIAHAKCALDHLSDSRGGPDLPTEAERFRLSCQQVGQLGQLLWSQFRRSTRRGPMTQRFWALALALGDPLTDSSFGDPQGRRDVFVFPSLLMQLRGAQTSAFAPIFRKRCVCLHPPFIGCSRANFRIL